MKKSLLFLAIITVIASCVRNDSRVITPIVATEEPAPDPDWLFLHQSIRN